MHRFSLRTLLLSVTIIGMVVAWAYERNRRLSDLAQLRLAYEEQLLEKDFLAFTGGTEELISLAYSLNEPDASLRSFIETELLYRVSTLSTREDELYALRSHSQPLSEEATFYGREILVALHCDSAEDFFQLARQNATFTPDKVVSFSQFHDLDSDEHKFLLEFVERCLGQDKLVRTTEDSSKSGAE